MMTMTCRIVWMPAGAPDAAARAGVVAVAAVAGGAAVAVGAAGVRALQAASATRRAATAARRAAARRGRGEAGEPAMGMALPPGSAPRGGDRLHEALCLAW